MQIIKNKKQGFDYLLAKYNKTFPVKFFSNPGEDRLTDGVFTETGYIPLLPWRSERRITELRSLVSDGILKGVSTARMQRIDVKGTDIKTFIYRELGICEFVLSSKIEYVYAVTNKNTAVIIAKTISGAVCTLELATTLPAGAAVYDKHEIIAATGIASDKVVDTQTAQDSVYLLNGKNKSSGFTDTDYELYGLSPYDISVVRSAFSLANGINDAGEFTSTDKYLKKLVDLVLKSAKTGEKIYTEGIL